MQVIFLAPDLLRALHIRYNSIIESFTLGILIDYITNTCYPLTVSKIYISNSFYEFLWIEILLSYTSRWDTISLASSLFPDPEKMNSFFSWADSWEINN